MKKAIALFDSRVHLQYRSSFGAIVLAKPVATEALRDLEDFLASRNITGSDIDASIASFYQGQDDLSPVSTMLALFEFIHGALQVYHSAPGALFRASVGVRSQKLPKSFWAVLPKITVMQYALIDQALHTARTTEWAKTATPFKTLKETLVPAARLAALPILDTMTKVRFRAITSQDRKDWLV